MFDCGEGAQRQMMRSLGLVAVDDVFLTHFHADHYLGLPGLLKTYDLQGRERPLRILGPSGLRKLYASLNRIVGRLGYEVELQELEPGGSVQGDGYEVFAYAVIHRGPALGYAFVEPSRPGRFDPAEAEALGITDPTLFGRLQGGETVTTEAGQEVRPEQVLGEEREGRKVVITGDTAPCEATEVAAHQAQLLVHDGSFADEETERAKETGHSTARQAAELARRAEVAMLALVHVSSRYNVGAVLEEAREVMPEAVAPRDFDLVEIPYPERGEPRLLRDGARAGEPDAGPQGDSEAQAEERMPS